MAALDESFRCKTLGIDGNVNSHFFDPEEIKTCLNSSFSSAKNPETYPA